MVIPAKAGIQIGFYKTWKVFLDSGFRRNDEIEKLILASLCHSREPRICAVYLRRVEGSMEWIPAIAGMTRLGTSFGETKLGTGKVAQLTLRFPPNSAS